MWSHKVLRRGECRGGETLLGLTEMSPIQLIDAKQIEYLLYLFTVLQLCVFYYYGYLGPLQRMKSELEQYEK